MKYRLKNCFVSVEMLQTWLIKKPQEQDANKTSDAADADVLNLSEGSDESDIQMEEEEEDVLGETEVPMESASRNVAPGAQDISPLPTDLPTQLLLRKYPSHTIGGKERRFTRKWYDDHKWLKYSVSLDAAFCSVCRHFAGTGYNSDSFISSEFRGWNRAAGDNSKVNAFLLHKNSECHVTSVEKQESFQSMSKSGQTVMRLIDKGHANYVMETDIT